ncbi:MAG: hypothetical protein WCS52_13420 [bacterium]
MKKNLAVWLASALAFLCATVTANATYVSDNFETRPRGALVDPLNGWVTPDGVVVTNDTRIAGTNSLYIPILSTISNNTAGASNQVWTDFYTIPRPFVSDSGTAPAIDTNATAQFFVNSNGLWVTISGNGPSATKTTVCYTVYGGGVYPTATLNSAYCHVSVLHDYGAKDWSLFVNDMPIATNLPFISSGVSAHDWFQVQNLGGSSTNVCWLDNFLVTNKMPTTSGSGNAITNVVSNTDIPVADALAYFGTVDDPRKTNQTVGVTNDVGGGAKVVLTFAGGAGNGSYVVYGSPNLDLSSLSSNGVLSGSGAYTNRNALAGSTNRFYYKLVTIGADGYALTNEETYAAHKQYRYSNQYSIAGDPVQTADRTMGGEMGRQLAIGLGMGDRVEMIALGGKTYTYTLSNGAWRDGVNDPTGSRQWDEGVGILVLPIGSPSPSYFAGLKITNALSVTVSNGWNYLSWAHNDRVFSGNGTNVLGFNPVTNDYIIIQTNGSPLFFSAKFDGSQWKGLVRPWNPLSLTIRAGDGMIYKSVDPVNKTFRSTGP